MRRVLLGLLLLPLLAGCAGPAARAGSAPRPASSTVHGTATPRPPDPEELQDLRTIAAQEGVPLQDEIAAHRGQAEFDALAGRLEADPSSGLVTAWRTGTGGGRMSFTHRPDAEVRAALAALPFDTTYRTGLPMAHGDLVAYAEAAAGSLDGIAGVRLVRAGPTTAGDAVEVHWVAAGRRPARAELDAGLARATAAWQDRPHVPVRFVEDDRAAVIVPA